MQVKKMMELIELTEDENKEAEQRKPIALAWNREAPNVFRLTDENKVEILQSIKWLVENSNASKIATVSYLNVIMNKSKLHVQVRLNEDNTIDFV